MAPVLANKFQKLASMMNEKLRRRWAACEAMAIGRGGISMVACATGMSRATIRKGIREVAQEYPDLASRIAGERIRLPGGGRRALTAQDATLESDLKRLIEPATRGEPTSALLWTSKSTRKLAAELRREGH